MYQVYTKEIDLGDGRKITLETGKLAKQADGSVVLRQGNTMILATVCAAKESNTESDFMPLSVDYQEKYASFGRFPGGFIKREGKPSEREILVSRLVDRALRPLFPSDYHAETFVQITLISADKDTQPDALAGLAASAALAVSDIPFHGPISEVRVSRIDGELKINPTFEESSRSDIEMIIGATYENILMVEGEMDEISEAEMIEAIRFGHEEIKRHCLIQKELSEMVGKTEKRKYADELADKELEAKIFEQTYSKIYDVCKSANTSKHGRKDAYDAIELEFVESMGWTDDEKKEKKKLVDRYIHDVVKKASRRLILDEGIRVDGRKTNEIRPIWCEVDYLPSPHGSAIFTRGETQSLTTVTLGTKMDEQIIDDVLNQSRDKFMLHYVFPPFSTGDARAYRGIGRREVGHGNLAHRALKRVVPNDETNPYTVRVVSDILESNGSSSMATVCAGTLALMDAGVKIKKPVSGIAMGLITDNESDKWAVLSDIIGDEDHFGDMDFKVCGTPDGITACQMDIKIDGLSFEVLAKALEQAKQGRIHIMSKMLETISAPREDYKPHAPRMEKIVINKELIGALIGPGGKVIQEIQATTNSVIVVEEVNGKGDVYISATNKDDLNKALLRVKAIVEEPEIGKTYLGKVKSIVQFGAFVEILPGKEGLLHISEIDWKHIKTVEEVLKEGQELEVQLIEFDRKSGKLKLSRKALLPRPPREKKQE